MISPPLFITDFELALPVYDNHVLDNGVPLYAIKQEGVGIVKFEIQVLAGRPFEVKKGVAQACGSLLKYGTDSKSVDVIDELLELKGASLRTKSSSDSIVLEVHCLTKYFLDILPVIQDIFFNPSFPQVEINKYINRKKEELKEDLMQNDSISYRMLTEHVYGLDHPYGYNSTLDIYDSILQSELIKHHKNCFTCSMTKLFISGDFDLNQINNIQEVFNRIPKGPEVKPRLFQREYQPTSKVKVNNGTTQSAIKSGWPLFNKSHPDFNKMYVVNTILGGYFGARLMANIRETKGLTYSIYSSLDTMLFGGFLWIDTELSHENVAEAKMEIINELEKLKTELISDEELVMVKSYLQGALLTMLDGAINQMDIVKAYVLENLEATEFNQLIYTVKNISAQEIMEMTQKYLDTAQMSSIVVGDETVQNEK